MVLEHCLEGGLPAGPLRLWGFGQRAAAGIAASVSVASDATEIAAGTGAAAATATAGGTTELPR